MKRVLILDWSEEWRFYITRALEELNCEAFLAMEQFRATPSFIKGILIIKNLYKNPIEHLNKIIQYMEENNIDSIFTCEDELVELAAKVAESKNLITCPSKVINKCMNKFEVRRELECKDVKMPFYKKIQSINDLLSISKLIDYPIILKPIDGNFSNGAIKVNSPKAIEAAWEYAYKATFDSPSNSREIIMEEYLSDEDRVISCEAVIIERKVYIVGLTEERQRKHIDISKNETFIYDMMLVPAQLDKDIQCSIEEQTKKIVSNLGLDNCLVHVEYKIKDGVPKFLEINPRIAGGLIPELFKIALGIDLAKIAIKLAMRQHIEETELKKSIDRVACAKFIVSEHSGTIENISYDNNLNSLDLDCLKMVLKKGDTFRLGELFGIGYIICSSNLTADAIEKTKKVLDGIKIEIS